MLPGRVSSLEHVTLHIHEVDDTISLFPREYEEENMNPFQSKLKAQAVSSMSPGGQRARSSGRRFLGISVTLALLLIAGGAFALQKLVITHAASAEKSYHHDGAMTTINGLNTIAQIGSTANILDAQGNQVAVDPNPYKIAIAPANLSNGVKAGDILVSNIGNNDHGVTLVKFAGQSGQAAQGHLFNTMTDGVLGPAGLAFDGGKLFVANSTGSNVLVFNTNGTLFTTIQDPLFNGPWGISTGSKTFGSHKGIYSFFTANKFDAKILRVDVIPQDSGSPKFQVTQIGQFDMNGTLTKIDLHWMPVLKTGGHTLTDVLLAIDPANNRIAAFAHSSTLQGTGKGTTVFQGAPLNMPGGLSINPFNGDLLVVNLMNNNLVELNPTSGQAVGVKQIDPVVVDNQGNGSALFGVVGVRDQQGNLRVFFTDDNTNTLDVLSAS